MNVRIPVLLSFFFALFALAQEKPTSLSDARPAVETNLRTPGGQAYDQQLGKEPPPAPAYWVSIYTQISRK